MIAQGQRSEPLKRKKKEESVVMVKAEGKSFVDIVKTLKEKVDIDQIGVKVRKLQKTGKGDLRVMVEGSEEMATKLHKEIQRKIEDVQVTTRKLGTTTIFILGIDPSTKEQEVRQAVATEIKVSESDIQIRALKKDKFGDQTVIAEVPRDQAAPLIKSRKIRIGWTDCGVRERMDIDRCFRCLEYGHKTRSCTAEIDRSNDCIKCGEKGHKGPGVPTPTFMGLKILQTNLGRGRAAHDLAYATAKQKGVELLIVCEPNKTITKSSEWIKDERGDVAVLFINKTLSVTGTNVDMEEYVEKVDEIANHMRSSKREAVLAGDINAKSHLWESPTRDKKGDHWAEWIAELGLVCHNTGGRPTFVRGEANSFIDVTLSTPKMASLEGKQTRS
ncbi:Endonuclease-reverse transcriptase [Popillia japonica]|uniref:Endonuclease-reverse transcriptase n=1 Tax=Popillia japonica TaxID=7064 RepID=A0AAW1IUR9_POPJA